ncbi:MAG: 16S rRNA (guanine(527)-N(7))-methyltransferase RsmG [Phycisphaerales bacterium]
MANEVGQRGRGGEKPAARGPERDAPAFPSATGVLAPPAKFGELCAEFGLTLDAAEIDRLGRYLWLLLETNTHHNLTAIKDADEAWTRHIFDSLTLTAVLGELSGGEDGQGPRVIDVGSGGGLPGIPLAIAMPDLRFTLLEATGKKAAFLRHAAAELGLGNVEVVAARAESAGREDGRRDAYDAAVARAVGPLAVIAELTTPFVRTGGLAVLVKGERAEEELAAAKQALHLLHAGHAGTVETPTGRLVVLEKLRRTPKPYPRRDGEPKRVPLGGGAAP